jgi:hypothetical protein
VPQATLTKQRPAVTPDEAPAQARDPHPRLRPPSLTTLVGLCLALGAWAVHLRPLLDNSFLWHLKTGHWILDHGIPRRDLFSFTAPDAPWVVQSWLAEALYAVIDNAFGPFGLQVLRAGVSAVLAYLMYALAVRLSGDRVRALLVTLPALAACFLMWNERPLLLGALAMLALVWVVELPESALGRRPLLVLPVLFWLWANAHGSFALGVAYVVVHLVGRRLDGHHPAQGRERQLLVSTGVALAACLLNPLGVSILTFPVHMLRRGEVMKEIVEWQSPSFQSLQGIFFGIFAAVALLVLARTGRRPSWRDTMVSAVFLGLGFWAARNIVLAPLVCLPIVARACAADRSSDDRRPVLHWAVVSILVMVGFSAAASASEEPAYDVDLYPVEAMQVVEDGGFLGDRLLTTDGWGGFVIHRYWPRQEVFIDDRYDMYPTELAQEYFDLDAGRAGWGQTLDRHDIEVVVWPVDKPLAALLDGDEGWARIHRDDLAGVWIRS